MLELNNTKYNIANRDDREEFHSIVDDLVMEHHAQDIIRGGKPEIERKLAYIHQLISEKDELALDGRWFGCVDIKYWHESVTDYLTDMGIEFTQIKKGCIVISIDGEEVLLTRSHYKLKEYEYDRYYEVLDGVVSEELLNKIGLSPGKSYYLEK